MNHFLEIGKLTEFDTFILTRESLDTSEFEVFCVAYTEWYGEEAAMPYIEQQFNAYLKSGVLPFYVRHFCRHYVEKYPVCVIDAQTQERRSWIAERVAAALLIAFVAAALLIS